jgi:hypothetical protein
MLLASRLKIMLADLGLTPETTGKMLHVHPRTVRYWISGKTLIPYSSYRLLRILMGSELPCNGWDGWHMHSGMLWSPEGHGFKPNDSSWWGLLVRQARSFKTMYDRETLLRQLAIRSGDVAAATNGAGNAGTLGGAAIHGANAGKPTQTPPSSNTGGTGTPIVTNRQVVDSVKQSKFELVSCVKPKRTPCRSLKSLSKVTSKGVSGPTALMKAKRNGIKGVEL